MCKIHLNHSVAVRPEEIYKIGSDIGEYCNVYNNKTTFSGHFL